MKTKHSSGPPLTLRKKVLEPAFHKYVAPFRIVKGKGFRLKNFDPGDTCGADAGKGRGGRTPRTRHVWLAK